MSFIRHEEIYPCDEGGYGEGAVPQDHALAHRNDESPAGYSSAGCSPAAPASASPAAAIILWLIFSTKFFAANGKLSPIPLSQLKGAVLRPSPCFPIFSMSEGLIKPTRKGERTNPKLGQP
jgi:hypothetical protein